MNFASAKHPSDPQGRDDITSRAFKDNYDKAALPCLAKGSKEPIEVDYAAPIKFSGNEKLARWWMTNVNLLCRDREWRYRKQNRGKWD
jgi:hypothetical protein